MNADFSKTAVLKTIKEYTLISIGLVMYSFAWTGILIPADVMGGGINGVGLLIYYATGGTNGGVPLGLSFYIFQTAGYLIDVYRGKLAAERKFLRYLLFASYFPQMVQGPIHAIVFISAAMSVMQGLIPNNLLGLGNDKLLSVILGGAVAGGGIGICFTQGGSTGGTDIIAMIVNRYKTISYGRIIMLCDLLIIGCSIFIFKNITAAIYGYVMVAVNGYTIDAVMAGNRQSTQVLIVSKKYEEIARLIFSEMRRGVTLLDGEGWYTKQPTKVVMVVCRKYETGTLFKLIKRVDPEAFMTVGNVMGVYGHGFEALKK